MFLFQFGHSTQFEFGSKKSWEKISSKCLLLYIILTQRTEDSYPHVTKSLMSVFFFFFLSQLSYWPYFLMENLIYIHSFVLILRSVKIFFRYQKFHCHIKDSTWHSNCLFPDVIIWRVKTVSY